jgi:L-amino acid N-acyltransferase YncA
VKGDRDSCIRRLPRQRAENTGSIVFHERPGFVEVARMPRDGFNIRRRLDLGLMQRLIGD